MSPFDDASTPVDSPGSGDLNERTRTWIDLPRPMMKRLHVMRILTGRSISELIEHCLASHLPELGDLADQPLAPPGDHADPT